MLTVGSAMHALIGSRSSSCCAVELFFNISTICSSTVRFIVWITSTEDFTFFTFFRILSHFVRGHFLSMSLRFALIFSYTSVMLLKQVKTLNRPHFVVHFLSRILQKVVGVIFQKPPEDGRVCLLGCVITLGAPGHTNCAGRGGRRPTEKPMLVINHQSLN